MDDNAPPLTRAHSLNGYGFSGKMMLISVVIFFSFCTIMACFHSYARWVLHRRAANFRRRRRAHHLVFTSDSSGPHHGLDPSVLKSLPTFLYSAAAHHPPPLECAVCLSEFQDQETARVLPKCNHFFHIDCIDMWFHSHSNCPICRAPVRPAVVSVSHLEAQSSATHCPDSSSSPPSDEGRKDPDSVIVHVEVNQ